MVKKVTHGGARKGAGRPPKTEGKAVIVAVSVPGELAGELDAFAKSKGWSRSKAVTEALAAMLKRKVK